MSALQDWLQRHVLAPHAQMMQQQGYGYPDGSSAPQPPPPLPPPPPPLPQVGSMNARQIYELYRPWLEAGIRDFPGAPGNFKVPVLSAAVAAGQKIPVPLPISLVSALYEMSGAATAGGTPDIGNLDAFRIQVFIGGTDQIPINTAPALGSAFFNRQTGIKRFDKPWVIPGGTNMTIVLENITGSDTEIDITVSVLQLEQASVSGG